MLTKLWIVGATGFTQGWDEPTGLEDVWRDLRAFSSAEVCVVTPLTWNSDAEGFAAFVARNSAPDAKVVFYGHSYGVGEFFRTFSRALQAHGIDVAVAVFADGIRRFKAAKFLSSKWFRSFFTIKVSTNVALVHAFHQCNDQLLQGHAVVAEDPATTNVWMWTQPDCTHSDSDNDPSFYKVVLGETRSLIEQLNLNTAEL